MLFLANSLIWLCLFLPMVLLSFLAVPGVLLELDGNF